MLIKVISAKCQRLLALDDFKEGITHLIDLTFSSQNLSTFSIQKCYFLILDQWESIFNEVYFTFLCIYIQFINTINFNFGPYIT